MNVVFADAGYFIANLDNRDPLHERARTVAAGLGLFSTVTTQMIHSRGAQLRVTWG